MWDNQHREELNDKLGVYLLELDIPLEGREEIIHLQFEIEVVVERAMIEDGYNPDQVFQKRHLERFGIETLGLCPLPSNGC
ncbi:hypothetical protein LIER_37050 [Lithospermum erythrorhizon]|uniref:Uncharacterized protein n=1 Tax=Lithospermum erythrorhizon TaxID=34254 RepID=A0AAV3PFZ5_LITER